MVLRHSAISIFRLLPLHSPTSWTRTNAWTFPISAMVLLFSSNCNGYQHFTRQHDNMTYSLGEGDAC